MLGLHCIAIGAMIRFSRLLDNVRARDYLRSTVTSKNRYKFELRIDNKTEKTQTFDNQTWQLLEMARIVL